MSDVKAVSRTGDDVRIDAGALQAFSEALRGHVLTADSPEGEEVIRATFGEKHARLAKLKAKYDPRNMFHLNQNIKPNAG